MTNVTFFFKTSLSQSHYLPGQEQEIEAILGMISTLSLGQNGLNAPKLFTVAQAINTQNSGHP